MKVFYYITWALTIFLVGFYVFEIGYAIGYGPRRPKPMSDDRAEVYATELAGRMMQCFNFGKELGVYNCRPYGPITQGNTTAIVHPVVTCHDGRCQLVVP